MTIEQQKILAAKYQSLDEIRTDLAARGLSIEHLQLPKLIEHDHGRETLTVHTTKTNYRIIARMARLTQEQEARENREARERFAALNGKKSHRHNHRLFY